MTDKFKYTFEFETPFMDKFIDEECSETINLKSKKTSNNEFSYRILNSWDNNGLIECERSEGKGWRKYSLVDQTWLYLISELRKFNFSIKQIQQVKKNLSVDSKELTTPFPTLEYYTYYALLRVNTYMLIFHDGNFTFEVCPRNEDLAKLASHENALHINLNGIMQKVLPNQDLSPRSTKNIDYTEDEKKTILLLRSENWDEVQVKEKGNVINNYDYLKNNTNIDTLIDEIKTYHEICIKTNYGKIIKLKENENR